MFGSPYFGGAYFGGYFGGVGTPTPTPTGTFVGASLTAVLLSPGLTAVLLASDSDDDPFDIDPLRTQLTTNSIEPGPPVVVASGYLLIDTSGDFLLIDSAGPDRVLLDG